MVNLLQRLATSFSRPDLQPHPPAPPVSSNVAPPTVTWPDPVKSVRVGMRCPNCRSRARKPVKLTVNFMSPDQPMRHSRVLSCPDCTCLFYEDQNPPDYTEESMLGRGRTAFYLQQGAGISLITRPLALIDRPPGSRYLEVGCGFGFGLDYAIRTKGWIGTGIDPAGLSAVGRDLLDIPIELRYLGDDEPEFTGTCDVVMASETIEHVPSPIAFMRTLKRALKPGGILILTTPNADEVEPSKSQGVLVPLLSPGLHLVFQNAGSLRTLMELAGFTHIVQQTDSVSLVAFASDAPFELELDTGTVREAYRAHLERRASDVPVDSDLFFAFAGRAMQESANDSEWARAERVYALLREGCRTRFSFDLDTLTQLPAEAAHCSLERLSELMPLNLGGIMSADAMRKLAVGAPPRHMLGPRFACAADAADAMRRALGLLAMEDGMSESIAWAARAEGLMCDAAAGKDSVAPGLAALSPAPPGGREGAARKQEVVERSLAWAVNAGHVAMARALAVTTGLQDQPWANPARDDVAPAPMPASRRDALFCLAVLDTQLDRSGDPARGARRFEALRLMLQGHGLQSASPGMPGQIARGELQALALANGRDVLMPALDEILTGMGDLLQPEAVADLRKRLDDLHQGFEDELTHKVGDHIRAVVTLVNEGRFKEARPHAEALADERFVTDETMKLNAAHRDALFAMGMLNLQDGGRLDHAEALFARVQSGLAADDPLALAAERGAAQATQMRRDNEIRRQVALEAHISALVAHVNAGEYAAARPHAEVLAGEAFVTDEHATVTPAQRDALFVMGMLNLQAGGDRDWAAALFARVRAASDPGEPLAAAAAQGEAQAMRAKIDAHLIAIVAHVNAGEYRAARPHADSLAADAFAADGHAGLTPGERDGLFAMAVLAVHEGRDLARAEHWFGRVRTSATPTGREAVPSIWWAAMRGELQAVRKRATAAAAEERRLALLREIGRPDKEVPKDLRSPGAGG